MSDREISKALQGIAKRLDREFEEIAGERRGYLLLVFNTEPGGIVNYISNCRRDESASAMAALIEKWGQGMPDILGHERN